MTKSDYAGTIALNIANQRVQLLVDELAALCVERDELKAKVADLEAKLNPKPDASSPTKAQDPV